MYVIINNDPYQGGIRLEPIQENIARNLAHIRKSRGLSLDKLSELTGVSKAMLAQIENGKSNPTVTTLWKIANGLQVSFSVFMKEADTPEIEKISITQLTPVIDDDGNYRVYPLFPFHPQKKFEIYIVRLQPGHSHTSDEHRGEEYILIQSGELTVEIHGKRLVLTENETVRFHSNAEHRYSNFTGQPVSYYMVIYYPDNS